MKRIAMVVLALLTLAGAANAGIVRHVVKPVAKASAKASVKTAKVGYHVSKAILY